MQLWFHVFVDIGSFVVAGRRCQVRRGRGHQQFRRDGSLLSKLMKGRSPVDVGRFKLRKTKALEYVTGGIISGLAAGAAR